MTKHIFIGNDDEFVNYVKKYDLDPVHVFTDISLERVLDRDVKAMQISEGYNEIIVHDIRRELNIKITHERIH